ncbi:MAG: hypothetical protein JKY43_08720 [Phycisphaerales bacterium]|nr:hypothetical protein [Phycisphaerales bacterium]
MIGAQSRAFEAHARIAAPNPILRLLTVYEEQGPKVQRTRQISSFY